MSNQVICSKCGHGNTFGHVFCVKCGAKLDMTRVTAAKMQGGLNNLMSFIALGVRAIVALAVVLLVVWILWPVEPRGAPGQAADVRKYKEKRGELDHALLEGQAGKAEFTEGEINAYLSDVLQRAATNETPAAWQLQAAGYNVALTPNAITVFCAARLGPLTLTYEVTGAPRAGPGPFALQIRSGRWGRLSLPQPAARWMGARLAALFHRWEKERTILDHAAALDTQAGQVVVTISKKQAPD
ncbi:MAG: zinc ribbon domain-containing protein [Kiritimatiellaeota bacterium]|nr:zinc ribbon domain-containing protein [Kiritimatiellota bacterium]